MTDTTSEPLVFISGDASESAAQEAIRVHVMRRVHRHRKEQRLSSNQKKAKTSFEHGGSFQMWMLPKATSSVPDPGTVSVDPPVNNPENHGIDAGGLEQYGEMNSFYDLPTPPHTATDDRTQATGTIEPSAGYSPGVFRSPPFPYLLPLAAEGDPSTSPLENEESPETILVNYYLQFGGGSKVTHDFYRTYCETTATYNAFLAIVASVYSDDKGQAAPIDPIELERRALSEISEQLARSPSAPPSHTMLAVAMLANLRATRNEHSLVQTHWNGLRSMIEINGGVQRLRVHQNLYSFLFWLEAVVLGPVTSSLGVAAAENTPSGVECQLELMEFFSSVSSESPMHPQSQSMMSSPVEDVLNTAAYKTDPYCITKWRNSRLSCLVFLATIAMHATTPLQRDTTYLAVEKEAIERRRKYAVYAEELYYVLVQVCNQDHLFHLTLKVARLVCAIKKLKSLEVSLCLRLLCSYLGFSDQFAGMMLQEDWKQLSESLLRTEERSPT